MNARLAGSSPDGRNVIGARQSACLCTSCRDPTGAYEVTLFSDTLELRVITLKPDQRLWSCVEATMESDQLKKTAGPASCGFADRHGWSRMRAIWGCASCGGRSGDSSGRRCLGAVCAIFGAQRGKGRCQLCLMDPDVARRGRSRPLCRNTPSPPDQAAQSGHWTRALIARSRNLMRPSGTTAAVPCRRP